MAVFLIVYKNVHCALPDIVKIIKSSKTAPEKSGFLQVADLLSVLKYLSIFTFHKSLLNTYTVNNYATTIIYNDVKVFT